MTALIVNTPTGKQEVIEVGPGGGYFDPARVIWDERVDGPLPDGALENLGGLTKNGKALEFSQARMDEHLAAITPIPAQEPYTLEQVVNVLLKKGQLTEDELKQEKV